VKVKESNVTSLTIKRLDNMQKMVGGSAVFFCVFLLLRGAAVYTARARLTAHSGWHA
jgi:hypothetical protein